jgi:hypothetical protein
MGPVPECPGKPGKNLKFSFGGPFQGLPKVLPVFEKLALKTSPSSKDTIFS